MGYFHALVTREGEDAKFTCRDLIEADVKFKFVKPSGDARSVVDLHGTNHCAWSASNSLTASSMASQLGGLDKGRLE